MNKIPLILIPGLLCDQTVWEDQIRNLSSIAEIIIPDLSQTKTTEEMIENILSIAPKQFYLAGHSMGGWLALAIAIKAKERVIKLLVLDTSANIDSKEKRELRLKMIAAYQKGEREALATLFADLFVYNKKVYSIVKSMFIRNIDAFTNQQNAMLLRENLLPLLSSINCPTTIIHARNDQAFSLNHSEEIVEHIPNAKLILVEDAGHMLTMEVPEIVTSIMREWLTSS